MPKPEEESLRLARRFYDEIVGRGRYDLIGQVLAPGFVELSAGREEPDDTAELVRAISRYRDAFPDLAVQVEQLDASADEVVAYITLRGTHTGRLLGVEPTGVPVALTLTDAFRCEQGTIVAHAGRLTSPGVFEQIGIRPQLPGWPPIVQPEGVGGYLHVQPLPGWPPFVPPPTPPGGQPPPPPPRPWSIFNSGGLLGSGGSGEDV